MYTRGARDLRRLNRGYRHVERVSYRAHNQVLIRLCATVMHGRCGTRLQHALAILKTKVCKPLDSIIQRV